MLNRFVLNLKTYSPDDWSLHSAPGHISTAIAFTPADHLFFRENSGRAGRTGDNGEIDQRMSSLTVTVSTTASDSSLIYPGQ